MGRSVAGACTSASSSPASCWRCRSLPSATAPSPIRRRTSRQARTRLLRSLVARPVPTAPAWASNSAEAEGLEAPEPRDDVLREELDIAARQVCRQAAELDERHHRAEAELLVRILEPAQHAVH